jgi:methylmalonyl-CoA mutase N-terminal domain/subunit
VGGTEEHPADDPVAAWRAAFEAASLRDTDFETMSGIPLAPVYGPRDWPARPAIDAAGGREQAMADQSGWPGQAPFTRGPYASMYRSRLWTMRMFAGFGTAEDTNVRFRELLRSGGGGLSVAFDLPTLMGRDSDDPHSEGEVGRCGVAIDTLADVEDLFAGIDLGAITTSMTINSPAAILLAMYVKAGESAGTPRRALGGTLQNDMLKEYQAQKEYIFPPRPSMRVVVDVIRFCAQEMPRFHPVSVSGYHIREAGSTAAQELAFTLANGFAYVEAATAAGMAVDDFAPRLSFFFNAHLDFFEEIAKYRAARRIWGRWMAGRYGAKAERSLQLRFHTQTAGVSLTAQQPEVNIVRTAIEALAGVLGGTQSLHTNSMDEVFALPTEKAARIALRTQQVLAHETGVTSVADPLGGSWFVESLTDEIESQAEAVFARLDEWGQGSILAGVLHGIETNWFQGEIADAAYLFQRKVTSGRRVVVGVNAFTEGNEEPAPPTLQIGPEVDEAQQKRLAAVRQHRSEAAVDGALARVSADAAVSEINLMPAILEAVGAYATVGEIVGALASVFGRWAEDPVV